MTNNLVHGMVQERLWEDQTMTTHAREVLAAAARILEW